MKTFEACLQVIRERLDKATPGPWKFRDTTAKQNGEALGPIERENGRPLHGMNFVEHDGEFIAHSRTDIARLLAVIEKLREQRKDLHKAISVNGVLIVDEAEEFCNAELARILESGE